MKILIFGGTTEGRRLSAALSNAGHDITLSVATEFGKNAAARNNINILTDRLDKKDIIKLLKQNNFEHIIDATHPYAVLVTKNICDAAQAVGIKYLRLKRPEGAADSRTVYVADAVSAVEILKKSTEKILLTVGSKELDSFAGFENYSERVYVRILPSPDSLERALDLGFRGSNIICMQGPFDKDMNTATLKMTGAKVLVTKDSGDAGGFDEKISAALELGCEVIVIGRPVQEDGYTLDELLELFGVEEINDEKIYLKDLLNRNNSFPEQNSQHLFFPLFVEIRDKKVLIIGGGRIAERRIKILNSFGASITVISPKCTEYIEHVALHSELRLLGRKYQNGDIAQIKPFLVITAADDRQANHEAKLEADSLGIQISVADRREECTCYFPAIAQNENYIAGLVSKNGDHAGVKFTAAKIRELLNT